MFDSKFLLSDLFRANGGDGSTGFILKGDEVNSNSGISVSSAGDINGDGIDDLIIGASGADDPANKSNPTGKSYVVFGKSNFEAEINLSEMTNGNGSQGFTIDGIDPGDFSGYSVSSAGDINGDGIDDLVIGARSADGKTNNSQSRGESYVVYGQKNFGSSLNLSDIVSGDGSNGLTIYGAGDGDIFGTSVSSAGDVNGDDIDDIIIGASFADLDSADDSGISYVIYGNNALGAEIDLAQPWNQNGNNGFAIWGADEYDFSGAAVSGAGDVNNDGIDDLIVSSPDSSGKDNALFYAGESYLIYGGSAIDAQVDLADLIDGDGSAGSVIYGAEDFDVVATSVSGAGDVNGDRLEDVIIGAELAAGNENTIDSSGESYVLFGAEALAAEINLSELASGDSSAGFAIYGIDESDLSGTSVDSAGDLNGDGIGDILIGARGASGDDNGAKDAGESYVIFGTNTANAKVDLSTLAGGDGSNGFVIYGVDSGDSLGTSVSTAGDVNGDGIDDIIIGANGADSADADNSGESYVIFGRLAPNTIAADNPAQDNNLKGTELKDFVVGGAGKDTLYGGLADDTIAGNNGNDRLFGDNGNDLLQGGDGNDFLEGCKNNDTLIGGRGADTINGNANNDALYGNANADILHGNGGDDLIDGGTGKDTMCGGKGRDIFVVRSGDRGNIIEDFADNSDSILLEAGLKFADLTITAKGGHTQALPFQGRERVTNNAQKTATSIIETASNDLLVTLTDVNAADISIADFS